MEGLQQCQCKLTQVYAWNCMALTEPEKKKKQQLNFQQLLLQCSVSHGSDLAVLPIFMTVVVAILPFQWHIQMKFQL